MCRATLIQQGEAGGLIPLWVLNMTSKWSLSILDEIRVRSQRNGHVVDAEVRDCFSLPPRLEQLDEEQARIADRCIALELTANWTPLASTSPFVKMWSRLPARRKGERQLAIGRASTTIDCSPLQALSWWYYFASRARSKVSVEEGNPARLIWKENGPHDSVIGTIKTAKFPLHRREFVGRQLCAIDDGVLFFFAESTDDKVDYGSKKLASAVRGSSSTVARFKPVEGRADQCEFHFVQRFDFAGLIPVFILNNKLPAVLTVAASIRTRFEKDDAVDRMEQIELARLIGEAQQVYTDEEETLIKQLHRKLGRLAWKDFKGLVSPDHLVTMGNIAADTGGTIRATVIVDTSVEECVAWEIFKVSRILVRDSGSLERSFTQINDHHGLFHVAFDLSIPGFQPREFLNSLIWKRQGDKLAVVYEPTSHEDFPPNPEYVRATSRIYYEYEKLRPLGGTPQTRVTLTQQVGFGGLLPRSVNDGQAVNQLLYLSTMRVRFDKSSEIDGATRARNVETIMKHDDEYSAEEMKFVEDGEGQFEVFNGLKAKALEMASPLTTGKLAVESRDRQAWGWASTTVRASPEEVLAFMWDTMRRSARKDDDLEKTIDENPNAHSQLVYQKKKAPRPLKDREFLGRMVWKKDNEGGFLFVTGPAETEKRPPDSRAVRGTYPSTMRIKKVNEETTLELVAHPDFGGDVPGFVMKFYMARNLSNITTTIQDYFQELRGLEEWDGEDGRAAGEVMCIKTKAEKHHEKGESKVGVRMRGLFKRQKGLKQIAEK